MANNNCLSQLACPRCCNDTMLYIESTTMAVVTDDGAETFGDLHWDDESLSECPECGHAEPLLAFRQPNESTSTTKEKP